MITMTSCDNPGGLKTELYCGWYALAYAILCDKQVNADTAIQVICGTEHKKRKRRKRKAVGA